MPDNHTTTPRAKPTPLERIRGPVATAVAIALAGILLRVWIAMQPAVGFDADLDLFVGWMRGLGEHGIAGFYAREDFCDYPPLMIVLFQSTGALIGTFTGDAEASVFRLAIKTLACLADLAAAALLFQEGRRLLGLHAGVLAGGLYLLNPVTVYHSAYWGQVDSIYTVFLLAAFVLVGRGRWTAVGFAGAFALGAKFQSIAVLPLVLFEAYRVRQIRGVLRLCAGALLGLALLALPFLLSGTLLEVIDRAYVGVIGQYHQMSRNAYNLWALLGSASMPDTSPPAVVARVAAQGRDLVHLDESWLAHVTWRWISLGLFSLAVATVVSLYARRPGPLARYGAAGALALAFFLFPTEMHERYAFPAVALLAPWAAAHLTHERIYWALSIALLLNLAAVLPPAPLAAQIAAVNLGIFVVLLAGWGRARPLPPGCPAPAAPAGEPRPPLIRAFQRATVIAWTLALGATVALHLDDRLGAAAPTDPAATSLATLTPQVADQGWKELARDRSVTGTVMRIDEVLYLRGLGSHAPATLTYEIPAGHDGFEVILGIDHAAGGKGSATVSIELDGEAVYRSPRITSESGAVPVRVELQGAQQLTLRLDPTEDGQQHDHVDLALARFTRSTSSPDAAP